MKVNTSNLLEVKQAFQPPQIRQLTELKSGIREDLHLIKSIDEGKAIINATHLRKTSVGDESNYKSPSGDLGVVEEEYEKIH